MTRKQAMERILELSIAELERFMGSYHNYLPSEVIDLFKEAKTAKPKRLNEIVHQVEERLQHRGFPPSLATTPRASKP